MGKRAPDVEIPKERAVVVLRQSHQHQGLVKVNRYLTILVFVLMAIIIGMGFYVLPNDRQVMTELAHRQLSEASYAVQNPILSDEINTLKGQVVGLISGSIESKLRILEESIKIGSLSASLGTIQDLRNDVKILRTYSKPSAKNKEREINEKLIAELSHLKNLVYFIFASCSLMIAALGGIWLRHRYRLSNKSKEFFLGRK